MKYRNYTFFLIISLLIISSTKALAQYKAIELNVTESIYQDDNKDNEYAYTDYWIKPLVNYNLAYSFPILSRTLLKTSIGTVWANSDYYQNPPGPGFFEGDMTVHKSTKLRYLNIGISTSYWIKSNYSGWFFNGGIRGHFITMAKSETSIRTHMGTGIGFQESGVINSDFKNEMHSFVPIVSIGTGYNLRIYYGLHLFANLNLDYRPTGYFKNTENITHINRRLSIGVKYAFNRIENNIQEK